jgi:hypothetical protein
MRVKGGPFRPASCWRDAQCLDNIRDPFVEFRTKIVTKQVPPIQDNEDDARRRVIAVV